MIAAQDISPLILPGSPLFGVTQSALGRRWQLASAPESEVRAISDDFKLPYSAAYILASRGQTAESARQFLQPTLRELMPDPLCFKDMDVAVERLTFARAREQRIAMIVDYDVDGQSAAAIAWHYSRLLAAAGQPSFSVRFVSPHRLDEGYGPNVKLVQQVKDEGADLVMTADCGVVAHSSIDEALRLGLDTIVTDHHMQHGELPKALAVVNPNRLDDPTPHKYLCGAAMVFMMMVGLNRALGHPVGKEEMKSLLSLVALATVADLVPLVGLNRALVKTGIQEMEKRHFPGLNKLIEVSGIKGPISERDLGFGLGPRVNAVGRLGCNGDYTLGAKLLTCMNEEDATLLAEEADRANSLRKEIQRRIIEDSETEVQRQLDAGANCIVLSNVDGRYGDDWHPGVVGVAAGRFKESRDRPAIVFGSYQGRFSGSARSVPGVNIGQHVHAAVEEGILLRGGGHAMAAGCSIDPARLTDFHAFMNERVDADLAAMGGRPPYLVDAVVSPGAINPEMYHQTQRLAPFGQSNPPPRYALANVMVTGARAVGRESDTVSCYFLDAGRNRVDAVAFRGAEEAHGRLLLDAHKTQRPVHVVGEISVDSYRGQEKASVRVLDVAWAEQDPHKGGKPHITLWAGTTQPV